MKKSLNYASLILSVHPLKALHIGSPNRMRWLGIKQRSGLWHRKTGRFGRKIRALPPVKIVEPHEGMFCFIACCIQLNFDFYWEHILARRIFFSVIFFRLLQQKKPLT